jgi:hypothetical protein
MLLGAVVDVALQPPPLIVLDGHDPLPGCLQLGRPLRDLRQLPRQVRPQPYGLQHQPRLGGQAPEQLLLHRCQGLPLVLLNQQDTEQLARVVDRHHPTAVCGGVLIRRIGRVRPGGGVRRPSAGQREPAADDEPYLRVRRSGALGQQPRHPGRHLVRRVRPGDLREEPGQHVVRRRPVTVHQFGGQRAYPGKHGLERERDDRCGEHGQPHVRRVGLPDERATATDDRPVHRGHEDRHGEDDKTGTDGVAHGDGPRAGHVHACSVL